MSKKRKKKLNPNRRHDIGQEILSDMLECGQCADAGTFKIPKHTGLDEIEHLIKVLPGIGYIENLLVDYIFSNGLTTGNIEQDEVLKNFLYRKNKQGNTNFSVLRDVIGNSSLYGETGLRWYEGDVYMLGAGTYAALVATDEGINYPAVFVCSNDGNYLTESDIQLPDDLTIADMEQRFREQRLILLDSTDFVNIRNTTKTLHGDSPLLSDALRVKLLEAVYSRLNYDIEYDGPGRLILRPKDGYVTGDINEVDTTTVVNQSMSASANRYRKAKDEVARVGREIRNSSSDDVILLSNAFDKDITRLERVTKATDFFDWLDNEGAIIAQAIGLPPSLLEMGKVSGNVSMQRILDNAMENAIVPLREKFATQFSPLLSDKLGIDKVYFGKYQPTSAPTKETVWTQLIQDITMLNSVETPNATSLMNDLIDMISYDIHNSDGSLIKLEVGQMSDEELYKLIPKESKSE